MTGIGDIATAVCLLIGSAFVIVGAIGLVRFNDSMTRLHAPTKVGTVGIGMLLLASMIHSGSLGETSIHETLIMAFLFVTAPISAHFVAKVNIHRRACETPPPPERDETWATLNAPDQPEPPLTSN
ncbi:Na+/H+ antiporter subunit G [Tateyamaria sp. SN6-1]|uniref:Na+/H+ antiporter subunit G n=1 Tax=Tateyamaria sp. SN6-1 TaxID=3092148 RepID=UPI0039F4AA8A